MNLPAPLQALKVPGVLVVNPTTAPPTDAAPHGGTALGLVRDVVARRTARRFGIEAEEYGGEVVEELYLGESWEIVFALRSGDSDAINNIFPNTTAHATSGARGIVYPGSSRRAGSAWSTSAVKLLFSPDDPDHRAVYFRAAVPMISGELERQLDRENEALWLVGFKAQRDGTTAAESIQIRLLEDLTL